MKKLIAILVVFAVVAGAAFAQGWGVWGSGEIGTIMNFVPKNADDDLEPLVGAHGYNFYDWYGGIGGSLTAEYNNGNGLKFGITYNPNNDWSGAHGALSFSGENVSFAVEQDIVDLLNGNFNPGRLWGWYKFLDEMITLEIAANSRDTDYWDVNQIVGDIFDSSKVGGLGFGLGWGFMDTDHHTYLLTDVSLSQFVDGLSLGFMLPGIFAFAEAHGDNGTVGTITSDWSGTNGWINKGNQVAAIKLKDSFDRIKFGVMYKGLVDVSLQFALEGVDANNKLDTGLDFDVGIKINDQISAGLGFQGNFKGSDADADDEFKQSVFAFGASFSYGAGPLSAGLKGGLYMGTAKDSGFDKGVLGIRPNVAFNLVENYLCLSLDAFIFAFLDSDLSKAKGGLGYEITPTLWFNVAGTGAGANYWWPNTTAIIVRYKVGGFASKPGTEDAADPSINALDITFKWAF